LFQIDRLYVLGRLRRRRMLAHDSRTIAWGIGGRAYRLQPVDDHVADRLLAPGGVGSAPDGGAQRLLDVLIILAARARQGFDPVLDGFHQKLRHRSSVTRFVWQTVKEEHRVTHQLMLAIEQDGNADEPDEGQFATAFGWAIIDRDDQPAIDMQ